MITVWQDSTDTVGTAKGLNLQKMCKPWALIGKEFPHENEWIDVDNVTTSDLKLDFLKDCFICRLMRESKKQGIT